jgi:hypothetical protein
MGRPISCASGAKALAVLGQVDGVGLGAQDGTPASAQLAHQLERRLPAKLDDHPDGLFQLADVQDVLEVSGSK